MGLLIKSYRFTLDCSIDAALRSLAMSDEKRGAGMHGRCEQGDMIWKSDAMVYPQAPAEIVNSDLGFKLTCEQRSISGSTKTCTRDPSTTPVASACRNDNMVCSSPFRVNRNVCVSEEATIASETPALHYYKDWRIEGQIQIQVLLHGFFASDGRALACQLVRHRRSLGGDLLPCEMEKPQRWHQRPPGLQADLEFPWRISLCTHPRTEIQH